jgi:ABC-type polysaccharide/polyol phosphate transport system ATPase subunit
MSENKYPEVQTGEVLLKVEELSQHFGPLKAVDKVSFEVKKGEILGITGKNGSGKSTLLRALANIFSPDEGTIDLHGHSIYLLAIGVGFKSDLTGRENIMLSGMLLGFSEQEVRDRMPEIIEFAGLGDFIDMPVRTYSSGMHSKLAFSITAILETDIMLIDEVLSVGDEKFKKKSYNKMKELISRDDRTVVIVSHVSETLSELCTRVMWLHDGEIKMIGAPEIVLPVYEEFMS